jgi:predicted porin
MNKFVLSGLATVLAAGCIQAQDSSVQDALASQQARISELEKKFAAKPDPGPFQFPAAIKPYVVIDLTISQTGNNTATGQSKVDMINPWFNGDRWGLRGTLEANVQDLNLIYKLESGFVVADGSSKTANVLFDRDAWIGLLSKNLGQFTFGRQNTLARDFSGTYCDPYSNPVFTYEESGWANQNNFKDMVNFAGSVDGSRMNKGMVWKKVTDRGLTMGAAYNLSYYALNTAITAANKAAEATTSTRDTTACVAVGYNGHGYNVSSYFSQANNAGQTQKSYSVGGNVLPSPRLRLDVGYFHYSTGQGPVLGQRHDTAYTVSGSIKSAALIWIYSLGYQGIKANNAGLSGGFMTQPFSNGTLATGVGTGARNTTYGSVMRSLGSHAEVYACADYEQLTDGFKLAATNGYHYQTEFGIGLKLRSF